jgi:hypothetical protein
MTFLDKDNTPVLLLTLSLPLAYAPKIFTGDTQPWILIASLISLFFVKNTYHLDKVFVTLLLLSFASVISFFYRSESDFLIQRNIYIYFSFLVFWIATKKYEHIFSDAIKFVVLVWFVIGLSQYVFSVLLGVDINPIGRYIPGRGGMPSLTAEPSFYGSLSVIQAMYLSFENPKKNIFFIFLALLSVVISGSILAIILLIPVLCFFIIKSHFSFSKIFCGVIVLLCLFLLFLPDGLESRLIKIINSHSFLDFFNDQSVNLRLGHIWFTLFHNLQNSFLLRGDLNFWGEYNSFAEQTSFLLKTKSEYILTGLGDLIYSGGIFSFLIVFILFREALNSCSGWFDKTFKVIFIFMLMLNPISISNFFLILFINQKTLKKI